jgi:hypothetical protein
MLERVMEIISFPSCPFGHICTDRAMPVSTAGPNIALLFFPTPGMYEAHG